MKIYLCDLIHSHFMTKEGMNIIPLNIGLIAAYTKELLEDSVDITLFKYPEKLIVALENDLPDVIGFSCYMWNQELVMHSAKLIKERKPDILIILGGPNIDGSNDALTSFLRKYQWVDYCIPYEGEEPFASLINEYINDRSIERLKQKEITGCANYTNQLNYVQQDKANRTKDIRYPSAYLTGTLDEFLKDPNLYPLLETNRGCPFTCAYCVWGISALNKMRIWPLEQVFGEMEYVYDNGVNHDEWIFADSNFGMFERDVEIAKRIRNISKRPNGVKCIKAWMSKNTKERNILIGDILGNLNGFLIAFQSLDKKVLKYMKRKDIQEESLFEMLDYFKTKTTEVETDILTGFPGETFESHLDTIRKCFNYGIRWIRLFNIQMLAGSELASQGYRKEYDIKTKYRLNRECFGYYWGEWIIDPEEIIVSTKSMSEDELLKIRLAHFLIWLFWNQKLLLPLLLVANDCDVNPLDVLLALIKDANTISFEFSTILNEYRQESSDEFFGTKEELLKYYKGQNNSKEALSGFEYLNFKYVHKIVIGSAILQNIVDYIEKYIYSNGSVEKLEYSLQEVSGFSLKRVCCNLLEDSLQQTRTMMISRNTYNFLVKENVCTGIIDQKDTNSVVLDLYLPTYDSIMERVVTRKSSDDSTFNKYLTSRGFVQQAIYQVKCKI